ncbi:MAG: indole-3-glycerol phosphate synthase TrpC [bacterium]
MNYKNTILEKIIDAKKDEIVSSKYKENLADLKAKIAGAEPTRDFLRALDPQFHTGELPETRIIAEIKKASPSAGLLRKEFDPVKIADEYLNVGAAAISVLTDPPFFQGSLDHLAAVRKMSHRPLLRKDFMVDPYQIYQARAYGADCILAIAAILEPQQLVDFCGLAEELRMTSLIEVHDEEELQIALKVKQERMLLGVNNRDLKTLKIDLKNTEKLRPLVPSHLKIVAESGISKREEVERLQKAGVDGFLIGETFLRAKNISDKFKELAGI